MKKSVLLAGLAAIACSVILSVGAAADDLDNVGTALPAQTTVTSSASTGTAPSNTAGSGVGNVYSDLSMNKEDLEAAKQIISPGVKIANIAIGVLVALLGTIMLAITVLDLVYIISPSFIRNLGSGQAGAGNPMGGQAPPSGGFASFISDDCKAAIAECGGGDAGAPVGGMPPMGGGMGGFGGMSPMGGMGGYGMSPMGGMPSAPAAKPKLKTVALCYFKKRVFSLVLIGICAVVLTCTCFLDLGTTVGQWIVDMVSGIGK